MSEFQIGDAVRVKSEVDLNKLFSSVTWPAGNIEGTVVGRGLVDCYYVDIAAFRSQSPTGYWPIYGHELEATPTQPDDLTALRAYADTLERLIYECATLSSVMLSGVENGEQIYHAINAKFDKAGEG